MVCTVATIIYFLGYMPPPGTLIIVPKSQASQLTAKQIRAARNCAARFEIKWRIED
jgi:hypothetical protein